VLVSVRKAGPAGNIKDTVSPRALKGLLQEGKRGGDSRPTKPHRGALAKKGGGKGAWMSTEGSKPKAELSKTTPRRSGLQIGRENVMEEVLPKSSTDRDPTNIKNSGSSGRKMQGRVQGDGRGKTTGQTSREKRQGRGIPARTSFRMLR